jgi:hypothetical protein
MQKQKIINFLAWTFVSIVGFVVGLVALIMILGTLAMHPYIGLLPESEFRLARESRLPGWFTVPREYKREDLDVEIYYYTPIFGKTNFVTYLMGPPPERKKLEKKYGVSRWHPGSAKKWYAKTDRYPDFNIVTVDGVVELIEHRYMAPIFHVSDDPELKADIK